MKRGKVLLIDDDEYDLKITKQLLEKVGYTVYENHGWFGSIKTIRRLQPDIILVDVKMPALSGDRLYDLLKKDVNLYKIPVIFYSSLEEFYLKKLVLLKGVLDYIPKGDIFQLYKKIGFYVKENRAINNHKENYN